jgi:hypothetical protein
MELEDYRLEDYSKELSRIIREGKTFNIKFYVMDNEIENKVETAINLLFDAYGKKDEYSGVVYTCVKELMINATKANLKRVLFEKNHVDIDNEDEYLSGMMEFRNLLNERAALNYLRELKIRDFWVYVKFVFNKDGIRIEVINNAHITAIEDKRLREKLKKAMGYDDIAQFYLDQGDEMEGAGMGIALIVMLLKGMAIDPALFRIGNTTQTHTFARLEIPLTPEYVTLRDRNRDAAALKQA